MWPYYLVVSTHTYTHASHYACIWFIKNWKDHPLCRHNCVSAPQRLITSYLFFPQFVENNWSAITVISEPRQRLKHFLNFNTPTYIARLQIHSICSRIYIWTCIHFHMNMQTVCAFGQSVILLNAVLLFVFVLRIMKWFQIGQLKLPLPQPLLLLLHVSGVGTWSFLLNMQLFNFTLLLLLLLLQLTHPLPASQSSFRGKEFN